MFAYSVQPSARFSPSRIAASATLHAAAIVLALTLRFSTPTTPLAAQPQRTILIAPILRPAPKRVTPLSKPLPAPNAPAQLVVPTTAPRVFQPPPLTRATAPKPRVLIADLEIPAAAPTTILELAHPTAILPQLPVIVGKLSTATTTAPAATPALGTSTGAFSSSAVSSTAARTAPSTRTSGFGNSTVAVASNPQAAIQKSTFGDVSTAQPSAPRAATTPAAAATTPVEILQKPRPLYTGEARAQHIEGEVLLEVLFPSAGPAIVLRVVRSLGYGLDESASRSVAAITFRPALRAGRPVDQTAIVHISFQLAN
ncbi:MAG: energy transducer TonB [Acidobacteriota bacterium]